MGVFRGRLEQKRALRWNDKATDEERLREKELSGGDWQIPLTTIPTDRHLQVTNAAYQGHLRYALGLEEECNMLCPCRQHTMTKLTAISCKTTSRATHLHNEMRDEFGHCARSAGVHPGQGEPRSQPWSSNAGGADAKYTGFTVGGPTDKSTVLVDVTYPITRAPTNRNQAKRSRAAGATAEFKEQEKIMKHEYVNVALLNGWSFMPAAQEKDTLHWGKESVRLLTRLSQQREQEDFDSHGRLIHGFKEGQWNAPTFFSYWKQRLTIKLVNTREKIIGNAEAWANRLQGTARDEE